MGPRAGLDGCGKSRPTGIRSPDLATTKASVFFFIGRTLLPSIAIAV
jgi:hypothetical protein